MSGSRPTHEPLSAHVIGSGCGWLCFEPFMPHTMPKGCVTVPGRRGGDPDQGPALGGRPCFLPARSDFAVLTTAKPDRTRRPEPIVALFRSSRSDFAVPTTAKPDRTR